MYLGLIIRGFNDDSVTLYMQLEASHSNWTFTPTNLGALGSGADDWYRINQFGYRTRPDSETTEIIDVTLNAYTDAGYSNLKWTFSRSITVFMLKSDDLTWDLDEYDNFDDGTIQGWAADTVENPPCHIDVAVDYLLSPIYSLKADNNRPTSFTSSMWLYKTFTTEDKDLVFAIANLRYDESLGLAPSFSASIRVNGETLINLPDPILDKWHHLTFPLPRNSIIEIRFYFSGSSASQPWWLYMWLDDFRIISKDRGDLPAIDLSQSEGIAFYWWGSGGSDQNIDFEMWSPTGGWVGRFADGPARWRWVFLRWSDLTEVDLDGSRPDPSDIREIYWTYHTDGVRRVNYIVGWRTQDLYGSFEIRNIGSAELYAHVVIQDTEELYAHAIIRQPDLADLFSRFHVGQDSADLFARFEVGQDSADLFGKAKIRHPGFVELFGKCNIVQTIQFSLREHKTGASDPSWVFSKPSLSICRAASGTSSIGNAYMFFNVSREYIHGKYIRITWQGDYTYASWGSRVYVYDGSYDRSSDVDFPSGAGMLLKSTGLLQTGRTRTGDFGPVTEEFLVDVSGGVLPNVMIMIYSRDAWGSQSGWIQVDTVEINSGAGGSGVLYRGSFNDSITMERTGTTGDYGYISEGEPPQAGSRELYASFTVNP